MKIEKIRINKYKSIKEPVEINFIDSLPTVLIGKNGSGKTNILEALSVIAEANGNYFGIDRNIAFDYEVHMRLTDEDIANLFPGKTIDINRCSFVAYPGERMKINRIESEYLVPLLNAEITEIQNTAKELQKAVNTYQKQLGLRSGDSDNDLSLRFHHITNCTRLSLTVHTLVEYAEKTAKSLLNNFTGDQTVMNFTPLYDYFPLKDDFSFELEYVKPELAPFEAKYVKIDEESIKDEIVKKNRETKKICNKITSLLKEIDNRTSRLIRALNDDNSNSDTPLNGFYRFIYEIRKCIGARCYFLKSENSNVIFKDEQAERQYYRNDDSSVILQTYLNKVYDGADKNELRQKLTYDKEFSLPDQAVTDFIAYLNKKLPEFENGMYKNISVQKAGKSVEIFLRENSGEVVSLNSTSSGRRWYFTYYFTKNALEKGDFLIVDEPASSLHPLAQKEVLQELLELEKQGIKVIYSTHSPYLIPDKWECVHFVSMDKSGTKCETANAFSKLNDFLKSVAGNDIFKLQEIAEKYKSGDTEKIANNCYQAAKTLGTIEQAANKLGLSIETLEAWRKSVKSKKFKCPKLENVLIVAQKTNTDISKLLE